MTTRKLHRGLAWPVVAVLAVWVAGGLLHMLMSWTQPQTATMSPPSAEAMRVAHVPVGDVLVAAGWTYVRELRLLRHGDALLLRVRAPGQAQAHYLHAADGSPASPAIDEERARRLAAHYLGEVGLGEARPVTAFDSEYIANQRLLPVWRVAADDGRVIFVDTDAGRLAGLSNPLRRSLQQGFRVLHLLSPLEGWPLARRAVITLLQLGVLAMAGFGIWMLLHTAGGQRAPRRRHRMFATAALLPILAFVPTGLTHLWVKAAAPLSGPQAPDAVGVQGLRLPAGEFDELRLVPIGGAGYWRGVRGDAVRYFSADAQEMLDWDDGRAVQAMAAAHGFERTELVAELWRFDADYTFLNRRLPVWRLRSAETIVHIDHRSGWLLSMSRPRDRVESRLFSAVHKGQWLDPAGRVVRDGVLSVAALWMLIAAVSGLRLRRRA